MLLLTGGYVVCTLPILIPNTDIGLYKHYKSVIISLLNEYFICLTQCSTVIDVLKAHVFTAIDLYELYSYLPRLTEVIRTHKLSIRVLSKMLVSIPYDYLYYENPSTLRSVPSSSVSPTTTSSTTSPTSTTTTTSSPLSPEVPSTFFGSIFAMPPVTPIIPTIPIIPAPCVYSAVRTGIWADFSCSIVFEDQSPVAFLAQIDQGIPIERMITTFPHHSSIDMFISFLYKCAATSHLPSLVMFTAWFLTQPMPPVSAIVGIVSMIPHSSVTTVVF